MNFQVALRWQCLCWPSECALVVVKEGIVSGGGCMVSGLYSFVVPMAVALCAVWCRSMMMGVCAVWFCKGNPAVCGVLCHRVCAGGMHPPSLPLPPQPPQHHIGGTGWCTTASSIGF